MPPLPPPPPPGHRPVGSPLTARTVGQTKTLVGGLPWQPSSPPPSPPPAPGMPVIATEDELRVTATTAAIPTKPLSWSQRTEEWLRRSPPFSFSLSLHVVIMLVLALVFYPRERTDEITIDLSFKSEFVEEQREQEGVPIEAPEAPEEEPVEEVADAEEPSVEDPVAAPVMIEEVADTGAGATTREVARNVPIGSLLDGRQEGRREGLVRAYGGSDATEAAVAKALVWLAKQQQKDGLWSLQGPYVDGGSQENRLAATAMALLAFQGAGNTPQAGRHKDVVARAWKALLKKQLPDGRFDLPLPSHHTLYSHAQATYAACELYGMTKDEAFAEPARRAVAFSLAAQAANGGWRYAPGEEGDMSVTGWFLMALKSAEMGGIAIPEAAFEQLRTFVDSVSMEGGSRYGYRLDSPQRPPTGMTPAVSAEGLLSRQFLGWGRDDRRIAAGIDYLIDSKFFDFEADRDVYAWYYITQVVHNVGGSAWDRWNGRMREEVPARQSAKGPETGSWDPALDKWGHIGGRLFTTCFCAYMLEVYYRHLPLYGAVAADP